MKKLKKLWILSWKNLKCHKWLNVKIVTALTFLMFILSLFSMIGISMSLMRSNVLAQSASVNYMHSYSPVDKTMPEGTQVIEYKAANHSLRMMEIYKELYGEESANDGYFFLSNERLRIEVGGEILISEARHVIDWADASWPWHIQMIACQNPFTDNDYKELKANFGLDNLFIGKLPEAADEVMLSATLLGYYNLSYKDVLGKQITFHFLDLGKMWEPFTVTGVIIPEYTQLRAHEPEDVGWVGNSFCPQIIVADDAESVVEGSSSNYIYSFPHWLTDEELAYLKEGVSNAVYFGGGALYEVELLAEIQSLTTNVFLILGVSFGVGLLLIIYLLTDRFIRYFVRGGGVLLTEGIDGRELKALTLIQILILSGIAVLASFVLTTAVYAVARVYLNIYVFYGWMKLIAVNGTYFFILLGVGLAMVLAVTLCLFLNIFILMRKKSIKELLNTSTD